MEYASSFCAHLSLESAQLWFKLVVKEVEIFHEFKNERPIILF